MTHIPTVQFLGALHRALTAYDKWERAEANAERLAGIPGDAVRLARLRAEEAQSELCGRAGEIDAHMLEYVEALSARGHE